MTVKIQQFYYNLLLQGYMFRLLRVIIRPSNEQTQDYLIPKTKRSLIYIRNQSVPRCKHFPSRL